MDPRLVPTFLAESARLRRSARWDRARLDANRDRQVARVRGLARSGSAFYRRFHAGLDDRPLDALPSLTKATMMEHFDEVVTDPRVRLADLRRHMDTSAPGLFLGEYRVSTSGGTSGEFGVVLFDRGSWARFLAGAARSRWFAGIGFNPLRPVRGASVVGDLPWLTTTKMMHSLESRFAPNLHLSAADPIHSLSRSLDAWQPEVLAGYTSTIGLLAAAQLAGRLAIRPRAVLVGGEILTTDIRERIAAAWGQEPFDDYACVEGGNLATECLEGRRMHLLEDQAAIEVVGEDDRAVAAGEWGAKVLVTPFWNARQPLIRYEISDSIRLSDEPCRCGRALRVVDAIRGRTVDILRLPTATGGTVQMGTIAFAPVVAGIPATWWQVLQEGDRVVLLVAGLPPDYDLAGLAARCREMAARHGAVPSSISVRPLAEVPRTAAGKARGVPFANVAVPRA